VRPVHESTRDELRCMLTRVWQTCKILGSGMLPEDANNVASRPLPAPADLGDSRWLCGCSGLRPSSILEAPP
jgi:hypothetical protein